MRNTLIDAGPIIGLFDRSDSYHLAALRFMETYQGTLWTTWPVITEVAHMLDFSTQVQQAFLQWIDRGAIQIFPLDARHLDRLIALTDKFDDVPMDLADASLIVVSEEKNIQEIASIDSDFYVYRDIRNKYLTNVFL
ncbi:MAG: PIN domain-containing protein [Cyclobacteriaceae bacterium]